MRTDQDAFLAPFRVLVGAERGSWRFDGGTAGGNATVFRMVDRLTAKGVPLKGDARRLNSTVVQIPHADIARFCRRVMIG